jgi:uncharacterized protein (TIGR00369 family)
MSTNISIERRYGVVSADERRALDGLEFVQRLVTGELPLNTMARTLGYSIAEATAGRVVVTADPSGDHLNPAGTVHGGFAATLLDTCIGLAVLTTIGKGFSSTTLEFKISLLRSIKPETGPIRAEGTVITSGRRIGTAEGRLTDSAGHLFAHGTTTCLIFDR